MRPKGTEKTKRRKKSVQKEKEREKRREKAERRITNGWAQICAQREREGQKEKKERAKGKRGRKEDGRRMLLCERHRKIATHLPQNYTFVFNSKDVWRKHAIPAAFT